MPILYARPFFLDILSLLRYNNIIYTKDSKIQI